MGNQTQFAEITKQLLAMKDADLALRDALIQRGELGSGYHPQMEELHNRHADALQRILDCIGYPDVSKVGTEASEAAWLIVQHSISRPVLMRRYRDCLDEALLSGRGDPIYLAYLSDRIAIFEGRPQRYGTQFDWDRAGNMSPQAIDDRDKVNERRRALGLRSLQEQTQRMRDQMLDEGQQAPPDWEARQREMQAWRKRVGWIS